MTGTALPRVSPGRAVLFRRNPAGIAERISRNSYRNFDCLCKAIPHNPSGVASIPDRNSDPTEAKNEVII